MTNLIQTQEEYVKRASIEIKNNPKICCVAADLCGDVYWFSRPAVRGMITWNRAGDDNNRLGLLPMELSKDLASRIWKQSLVSRTLPIEEQYPIDTLVRVTDNNDYSGPPRILRYSCGRVDDNGRLLCWSSGRTSRTVINNECAPWKYVQAVDQ